MAQSNGRDPDYHRVGAAGVCVLRQRGVVMAERRAITSDIWDDDWFGSLPPVSMLIWIGLFSRLADDQGRLQDNAVLIRSKLFPYQDIGAAEIEAALVSFNGRIIRYEVDGKRYIQIKGWWKHQPKQWAVPSNFPPPPEWVDRYRTNYKGRYITFNWPGAQDTELGVQLWNTLGSLARVSSWIDHVGRLNPNPNPNPNPLIKESTGCGETPSKSNETFTTYEREIGPLTPRIGDMLTAAEQDYPAEWIIAALEEAARQNKRSWAYTEAILKRWKVDGFQSQKKPANGNGNGRRPAPDMTEIDRIINGEVT